MPRAAAESKASPLQQSLWSRFLEGSKPSAGEWGTSCMKHKCQFDQPSHKDAEFAQEDLEQKIDLLEP